MPIWPYDSTTITITISTISILTRPPHPNQNYEYALNFPTHKSCLSSTPSSSSLSPLSPSPYLSAFTSPSSPCSTLPTKFHCSDRRTGGLPAGTTGVYVVVEFLREETQCVMQAVRESTGLEIGKTRCERKRGMCLVDLVVRDTRERDTRENAIAKREREDLYQAISY
ncbi:hypothetical protein EAE99_001255 [Botrytis elliptica]|nr:hypothetical protein EAE99_001255 [Botrytis elliptica]